MGPNGGFSSAAPPICVGPGPGRLPNPRHRDCPEGMRAPPPPKTRAKFLHCVHTAHAEAGILTQVTRLVVTVLFPRNPFQKNEQSKNI